MRAMDEDEEVRVRWCVIREGEKTGDPMYGVTVWRPTLTIHSYSPARRPRGLGLTRVTKVR